MYNPFKAIGPLFVKAGNLFPFLKSVFSEDGQGSYSRVASGIIVFSTIFWVTYLVIKHAVMPDLTGPAAFLSTGVGVHYGTNKMSDIVSAFKGNNGNGNGSNVVAPPAAQ
jgi:hypothetical protein